MSKEIVRSFRHELKYLISESEAEVLKRRLAFLMSYDPHAGEKGYFIRSLYFDDLKDSALEDKYAGIQSRHKYRIRIYNCQDHQIMLERKRKEGQFIQKTSASLTREEYEKIWDGDYAFLLQKEDSLCHEFYHECMTNVLRPVVIVDYDRIPFICQYGDVRITFDEQVRAAGATKDIFDPNLAVYPVIPAGTVILEVKFTEYLPSMIKDLLDIQASTYISASKYVLCMEEREKSFMKGKVE